MQLRLQGAPQHAASRCRDAQQLCLLTKVVGQTSACPDAHLFRPADWMRKLVQGLKQNYSGTEWAMYTTGHSLGASVAQAMHIKFADDVQYSCLFENPGVPRYWRDQAGEKGVQHWKQHSTGRSQAAKPSGVQGSCLFQNPGLPW